MIADDASSIEKTASLIGKLVEKGWLTSRPRFIDLQADTQSADPVHLYSDPVLLRYFAKSSEQFMVDAISNSPGTIVDLGCGPGHCTRLLSDLNPNARVIGLDHGENYLALANEAGEEQPTYLKHDITKTPFPTGLSDVLYCRFCMTHLEEPQSLVANWGAQLNRGGLMLLEETERTETKNPVFQRYFNGDNCSSRTNYMGPVIDQADNVAKLKKIASKLTTIRVETPVNALLYRLNIQTQKANDQLEPSSRQSIERLEQELRRIYTEPNSDMRVDYTVRQVVFERI